MRRGWRGASRSAAAMWFAAAYAPSAVAEVLLALVEEAQIRRRARREVCGGCGGGRGSELDGVDALDQPPHGARPGRRH